MSQTITTKTWLYLARRDSTGVRILMTLNARNQPPARLPNVELLQLPFDVQTVIARIIDEDRMLWEPWIESAPDYETLRSRLKARGYSGLPINGQPAITHATLTPNASVTAVPKKQSMLRKKG